MHISQDLADKIACANGCSEMECLQSMAITALMDIIKVKENEMARKLRAKDEEMEQLKEDHAVGINSLTRMYQTQIEWKDREIERLQTENDDLKAVAAEVKTQGNPLKQLAKATEKVAEKVAGKMSEKVADKLKDVKEKIDGCTPIFIESVNYIDKQELNYNKEIGQQIAFAANVGTDI